VTEALYLTDAYLKQFDARVVSTTPEGVILDRSAFYPAGGGQPSDQGILRTPDRAAAKVIDARGVGWSGKHFNRV
jgi:Ser-tRNA(Ala) deacylase AlaX